MCRLGDEDASIFDEPCINCSRPSTDNTFDPKKLQQAQKTDLQIYADKLKKGTIVYKDYKPIPLAEQEKLLAEELETNKGQKAPTVVPIYYYHPDHLGTSTALTDFNGSTYQFFLNLPFGETMAQQLGSNYYNSPYKFNVKELDEETGLYYYGARYYDPRTSIWLSVDPLAEKYPNVNPYVYTIDNPINLIDPNGKAVAKPPMRGTIKFNNFVKNVVNANIGQKVNWSDKDGSWNYDSKSQSWVGIDKSKGSNISFNSKSSDDSKHGGFAFADGGNNQDPSSLDKGGRDVQWIDFKGILEIFTLLLGTDRESPATGKVTLDTKTKNAIDAVNNVADATKAATEEKSKSKSNEELYYITYDKKTQIRTYKLKDQPTTTE